MPTATDAYTSGLREARRPGGGISWKTVSDPEADRMVVDMAEAIIAEGGLPTTKRIIESLPISPYAAKRAIARLKKRNLWRYGELCRKRKEEDLGKTDAERSERLIAIAKAIEAEGRSVSKHAVAKRARMSYDMAKHLIRIMEKEGRWAWKPDPRTRSPMKRPALATDAEIARNIAQALPDAIAEAQRLRAQRLAREKAKRLAAGTVKGRCDEAVSEYRKARRGCRKLTKMVRGMMEARDATL